MRLLMITQKLDPSDPLLAFTVEWVRRLAARLEHLDVLCLEVNIAPSELPALYQTATLYALSSNYEGLPGVLLEASAASLPIVSTANNGSRDLITDAETGILTPIGDEVAMANAILALINEPERRRKLGNAAREHVFYAFDETRLLTRWVDMWRDVAAGIASCDS